MKEEAVLFGETGALVGIITDPLVPQKQDNQPAFIILNSGLIHRVGSNRLSVKIARKLAALGFLAFRIDFSGIGDSLAQGDNLPVMERWKKETQAAMGFIEKRSGIKRFVLLGNCSGAALSFLTARTDPRVTGIALINLQGHKTPLKYFFKLAVSNPKIWLRIIRGSAQFNTAFKALYSSIKNRFNSKDTDAYGLREILVDFGVLIQRRTDLLFVYSEWDPGLTYFEEYLKEELAGYSSNSKYDMELIPGMNHDFNLLRGQEDLVRIVCEWASQMLPKT